MPCNAINSTLEIITLVLLLCLLGAVCLKPMHSRRDRMFAAVLGVHFFCTLGDLLAWRFTEMETPLGCLMTNIGNIMTYALAVPMGLGFVAVLYHEITHSIAVKKTVSKAVAGCICVASAAELLLVLSNFRTGLLYTIDADNTFTWGPLSGVPDNLLAVQLVLLLPLVLLETRRTRAETLRRYLGCAVVPLAALLAENIYTTLMLVYPFVALSLMIVYMNVQYEQELELVNSRLELANSRVRLLTAQIQPHFIFNSLLEIQELCHEDPEKASRAIVDFSKYLRGNLDAMTCDHLIPFAREMEHVRHYLALEQADPSSRLQVEYRFDVTEFAVPPLSVQPLVENAVRHGIGTRSEGGLVRVTAAETPEEYRVMVWDDGRGFTTATLQQQERGSIGIQNVRARLAAQCGGTLTIESGADGTAATIHIPKGQHCAGV